MTLDDLSDEQVFINSVAQRLCDLADHDYIAARLLFRSGFHEQYILLGQQAIEKYLKSILLFNGIRLVEEDENGGMKPRFSHGLKALLEAIEQIDHIKGCIFFSKNEVREYFLHIFDGAEHVKYGVNGSLSSNQSFNYLDKFVFYYRGFCRYAYVPVDTKDGCVYMHRKDTIGYPHNNFGILKEVERGDKNAVLYKNLIWKNHYWGKRKKPGIVYLFGKTTFKNPVFWGKQQLEWLSKWVFIPKPLKNSFSQFFK